MDLRDITDNVQRSNQQSSLPSQQQEHATGNVKQEVEDTIPAAVAAGRSAQQASFSDLANQLQDARKRTENVSPRTYLDSTVVPTLLEGLKHVVLERPSDPLAFLGQYLLDCSANLKAENKNTTRAPPPSQGASTPNNDNNNPPLPPSQSVASTSSNAFVKRESQP
ncbi:hypothetical protein BDA99DRAFT_536350 [Phascolomyces articulosus]|uniref:Uncharacterized protein n=1 Tax=Phascolomyces articulosus TaxID=60185 RepID=A0AAD5K1F8_9FUNG|nr:hypothetical protein BDA99DRAFT_536350 [Phascolomyces articulosus]